MRIVSFLLLFFCSRVFAQYAVSGKVTDFNSKLPIEYATLTLLGSDSAFISGTVTNQLGIFDMKVPGPGKWLLKTAFIGYERNFQQFVITETQPVLQLSEIVLTEQAKQLNEVLVEGKQDFVQHSVEKQVYQVADLGTTQGGTAAEVLQTIPSVTVDQEGTPSLRGTNVIVLIDGRPSGLSGQSRSAALDQIPASTIERIEVVSNPSARYDPDGMSGIINVILKKNKKAGYNGSVSLTAGDRDKFNAAVQFNYRKGNLNWFTNYSYNYSKYYGTGSSDRKIFGGDTLYYIRQQQNNDNLTGVHLLKTGLDYQINSSNFYTTGITFNTRDNKLVNEVFDNTRLDAQLNEISHFARTMNRRIQNWGVEWTNNFTRNFAKKGSFLSTDATISFGKETIERTIGQEAGSSISQKLDGDTAFLSSMPENGQNYLIVVNSDFTYPLNDNSKVDAGVKASVREVERDFTVNDYRFDLQQFAKNEMQSNRFLYNEQLYSGYGVYSGRKGKFAYQGGARIEQALTRSDQKSSEQRFTNYYLNVFPSAYLTYKMAAKSEWKATYSRRIVRPDIQNLNPFVNYADRFNLRRGNPTLQPEYVNSYEFGHLLNLKKLTLSTTAYYRQSSDLIWRYRNVLPQGVTVVEYQNISGSETFGFELVNTWQVQKWWSLTTSGNVFKRQIFTGDFPSAQNNNLASWNLKVLTSLKPLAGTDITLSYTYDSPAPGPQGKILAYQGVDISAKRDLFKKKASIGLRFTDVFNTRRFRMEMDTPEFADLMMRKRESRNAFVTFTWKFGREDGAAKKQERKKGGINSEGTVDDAM